MLREDRVCYNCGKRWGQHYDEFCRPKDTARTFVHDGSYCTPQGKTFKDTTKDDPNFLFRRREQK